MQGEMIGLRLIHIVCGVLWAGWAFSLAFFVQPAVKAIGQQGSAFMQALTSRTKLVSVMTIAPLLVILTGIRLLWIASNGFDAMYLTSVHGTVVWLGSLLGILTFGHGMSYMRPRAKKIGMISASIASSGQPPTPEQQAQLQTLSAQIQSGSKLIAWMMGITVVFMAVSRYIY